MNDGGDGCSCRNRKLRPVGDPQSCARATCVRVGPFSASGSCFSAKSVELSALLPSVAQKFVLERPSRALDWPPGL